MIGKSKLGTDGKRRTRMAIKTDDGFTAEAMGWTGLAETVRANFGPNATLRYAVSDAHYWKSYVIDAETDQIIVGVTYVTSARSLKNYV